MRKVGTSGSKELECDSKRGFTSLGHMTCVRVMDCIQETRGLYVIITQGLNLKELMERKRGREGGREGRERSPIHLTRNCVKAMDYLITTTSCLHIFSKGITGWSTLGCGLDQKQLFKRMSWVDSQGWPG